MQANKLKDQILSFLQRSHQGVLFEKTTGGVTLSFLDGSTLSIFTSMVIKDVDLEAFLNALKKDNGDQG